MGGAENENPIKAANNFFRVKAHNMARERSKRRPEKDENIQPTKRKKNFL